MNVIEKTRELGTLIQADERYKAYLVAKEKNDSDKELQEIIKDFNMKRVMLNTEMSKENKSQEKIDEYNEAIKALYADIMRNENMTAFNKAKEDMDEMLSQINMVITMSANGEDPLTCPVEVPQGCSGSCSSCSGCH